MQRGITFAIIRNLHEKGLTLAILANLDVKGNKSRKPSSYIFLMCCQYYFIPFFFM